jgi:hypothetical protein
MQIVVGAIARAAVRVSTLVNRGSLADFQRSSRIATEEVSVMKTEWMNKKTCQFAKLSAASLSPVEWKPSAATGRVVALHRDHSGIHLPGN